MIELQRFAPLLVPLLLALWGARSPVSRDPSTIGRVGWVLLLAALFLPGPEHGGLSPLRLPLGLTGFWWIGEAMAQRRRGTSILADRTEDAIGIVAASLATGFALHLANGYAPNWYWAGLPGFPFARFGWLAWTWMVMWPGLLAWHFALDGEISYTRRPGRLLQVTAAVGVGVCLLAPADSYTGWRMLGVLAGSGLFFWGWGLDDSAKLDTAGLWRLATTSLSVGIFFELMNLGSAAGKFTAWVEPGLDIAGIPVAMLGGHVLYGLVATAAWPILADWLGLSRPNGAKQRKMLED